jgi:hypothetical protein
MSDARPDRSVTRSVDFSKGKRPSRHAADAEHTTGVPEGRVHEAIAEVGNIPRLDAGTGSPPAQLHNLYTDIEHLSLAALIRG